MGLILEVGYKLHTGAFFVVATLVAMGGLQLLDVLTVSGVITGG